MNICGVFQESATEAILAAFRTMPTVAMLADMPLEEAAACAMLSRRVSVFERILVVLRVTIDIFVS
jgi:hypothetical protein